jgi:UDP-glucuronate 4-epimerase
VKILVTGSAGFIGFHVARKLLERGDTIIGIDSLNDYYDVALKQDRLKVLEALARGTNAGYEFICGNIANNETIIECFTRNRPDRVIHLAAQAGVRYSLENPHAYVESNIVGFTNILEACRTYEIDHLTYASTSSVYGANTTMPFSEHHGVNHPLQFYAATKRANELMAHSYSHLFRLPTTGLRFFTVYGPWGRPDMAPFKFTRAILEGQTLQLFNHGNHSRDFTYIDDISEGVIRASDQIAQPGENWSSQNPDPATSNAPFRIFNIGNNKPVKLADFIAAIEKALDRKAITELLPIQPGDVPDTFADISELEKAVNYRPGTDIETGVAAFVDWYRKYYGIS